MTDVKHDREFQAKQKNHKSRKRTDERSEYKQYWRASNRKLILFHTEFSSYFINFLCDLMRGRKIAI